MSTGDPAAVEPRLIGTGDGGAAEAVLGEESVVPQIEETARIEKRAVEPGLSKTREIARHCMAYREPVVRSALVQLANTGLPYINLCAVMVTLRESVRCLHLALWDENARRLVGFPLSSRPPVGQAERIALSRLN